MSEFEAGQVLAARASLKERNPQPFTADLAVCDDATVPVEAPVIEVGGLAFQSIGSGFYSDKELSKNTKGACASWVWSPDITIGDPRWLIDRLRADYKDDEFYMISIIMSTASGENAYVEDKKGSDAAIAHETGSSPTIQRLGEGDTTEKTRIFVGEVEDSLLAGAESGVFTSITPMLINCKAILWVTRGSALISQDPCVI
ncbi:hypothetical protein HRG_006959 [Hirsutella rhossiliensis]|uniref:Uncharacterized protein n=1 Tax=Hirsutella rhossiliensis TaxID=111463 RepID=A0A9P8SH76_9HYPO|nr:uncharacterized protein HRG_06959 [Hirsutella rhossiliensis]KAH0961879.1 hypothetical protein HRG_06959 [Hirsutella rhossiliensis]